MKIGWNLPLLRYFDEPVCTDLMRQRDRWRGADKQPTMIGARAFTYLPAWPDMTRYVVEWDGKGTLSLGMRARVVENVKGRMVVECAQQSAAGHNQLKILTSDPSDPVRYVRVYRASDALALKRGDPFTPEFIEKVRLAPGVLRFMDWCRANAMPSFADWPLDPYLDMSWGLEGVPLSVMLGLAARMGSTAWVSLPHDAAGHIPAIRKVCNRYPGLKIVFEDMNEVWNTSFPQGKAVAAQAKASGTTVVVAAARRTARLSKLLAGSRYKLVMGARTSTRDDGVRAYEAAFNDAGGDWKQVEALIITLYFNGLLTSKVDENWAIINRSQTNVALTKIAAEVERDTPLRIANAKAVAKRHGVKLYVYEGNFHLNASSLIRDKANPAQQAIVAFFAKVQEDRGAAMIMRRALEQADRGGVDAFALFTMFSDVSYNGIFGVFRSIRDREGTQSWKGVAHWMEAQPPQHTGVGPDDLPITELEEQLTAALASGEITEQQANALKETLEALRTALG